MQVQASAADEQDWIREALAEPVRRPCWRVWRYRTPAIVLGLSQRRLREAVAGRAGSSLPVLVRASGGGAVLVGPWMVSVTVVLPVRHRLAEGALVDSYRWLGELHARVLRRFGVETRLLQPQALREGDAGPAGTAPLPWACFGALSPWELVDDEGRKLCGLAQQRRANGIALVAGTLMRRPPWPVLCEALDRSEDLDALTRRTTDCAAFGARGATVDAPDEAHERFAAALAASFDAALARALAPEDATG